MLVEGINTLVRNDSELQQLGVTTVVPEVLPEGACMPAIMYRIVGGNSEPTFDTSGMQRVRIEFNCFGESYLQAATVRERLRVLLNGYVGLLSDGTYAQNIDLIQTMDGFQDEARQIRCLIEFYVYFTFTS